MSEVWVLGGAGFVGSAVARAFADRGDSVTVVDGFLPETGAERGLLGGYAVRLIDRRVEELTEAEWDGMARADVIVDAMAWTSHVAALQNPFYDLELNVQSHLRLLTGLPKECGAHIIYLGSRGQYGRNCDVPIMEGGKLMPDDIQGIHKTAADHYCRIFSKLKKLHISCLRFPNCFGEGQKTAGDDIGLIGGFIRDALAGKRIDVFGAHRSRSLVCAEDVAACVLRLSGQVPEQYEDYNLAGVRVNLVELVRMITELAGSGSCQVTEMPETIRAIDMGDVPVCEDKLRGCIGEFDYTGLSGSLQKTIAYFRRVLA